MKGTNSVSNPAQKESNIPYFRLKGTMRTGSISGMSNQIKAPEMIDLGKIGNGEIGYITVCEYPGKMPFAVKRVYWTYLTPENIERGNHAHLDLEQIIVAVSGRINFELEDLEGNVTNWVLDSPSKGLYIPPLHWRRIRFFDNAVLLCMASHEYSEQDYIRDYEQFRNHIK